MRFFFHFLRLYRRRYRWASGVFSHPRPCYTLPDGTCPSGIFIFLKTIPTSGVSMIRRLLPMAIILLPLLACSTVAPTSNEAGIATQVALQLTAAIQKTSGSTQPVEQQIATEVARQLTVKSVVTTSDVSKTPISPSATSTATITSTSTLTPTSSSTPSFTPPASDPALTLGSPTWHDNFDNGQNWYLDDDGLIRLEVKDHKLNIIGTANTFYDTWRFAPANLAPNYYLQMNAQIGDCSGMDRFGLILGSTESSTVYMFGVTCDGKYSFRFFDGGTKKYTQLISWTASGNVNAGSNNGNRLGVKVEGTHLAFYINGHYVGDKNVPAFAKGRCGIYVSSEKTANFHLSISDFAYWKIP
jgi:hypothetical protein